MQRPLGWRVCGGVEEFLEKCSLVSQAIVEEPPREAVHWEVTEPFFLVWFVLAALLREFNKEFYRLYRII